MYQPPDYLFYPVPGLELGGVLGEHLRLSTYESEEGVVWMRALLLTRDSTHGDTTNIVFATPYPDDLPREWITADFIAWVISHEMMECVRNFGRPLYHTDRLERDHAHYAGYATSFRERLQRVRQRFHEDTMHCRWECGPSGVQTLSHSLGLWPQTSSHKETF